MVGHGAVDRRDAGDVDHHDRGAVVPDRPQELLGELAGALGVEHADDRQDEQALAQLEDRRGQLPHGLLLVVDDPLALLDEAHPDRHRDSVGGGLVLVQDAIQELEIVLVLREQRARQHVSQEEHDPEHLMRLDARGG